MIILRAYNNKDIVNVAASAAANAVAGMRVRLAKMVNKLIIIAYSSLLITHVSACSVIDDDLSDCPPDDNYRLDYELRLVTNLTTELQTELTTQTEVKLASALRAHLSNIFTDYAHDVDLSFYDTQGDSVRLHHDEHIMDANQASYTLNLPMRQYMHLAVANILENDVISLTGDDQCPTSMLSQTERDTIPSHNTGLFTARLPMEVLEGVNQNFNVHLYMANCASTLVVDTLGSGIRSMKVYSTGFATGFNLSDSTFLYVDQPPVVRTDEVKYDDQTGMAFCSVTFPSREEPAAASRGAQATRTVIETTDPFISESAAKALWQFNVYAVTADGKTTESKLYINLPLRAGQLKVLKAKVRNDGAIATDDQEVAVSVTLDWTPGGHHEPILVRNKR